MSKNNNVKIRSKTKNKEKYGGKYKNVVLLLELLCITCVKRMKINLEPDFHIFNIKIMIYSVQKRCLLYNLKAQWFIYTLR